MHLRVCRCFCLCLLVLLGTARLWADVTGSILGYVRDKSGAVLPNANVTATETATGYSRTVATDSSGQYSILALPPGHYRLAASVAGFQQQVLDNVDLNVNDALHFDFLLQVGSISESISVEANALQVQTVTTATGTTIESRPALTSGRRFSSKYERRLLRSRTRFRSLLVGGKCLHGRSAGVGQRLPGEWCRGQRDQEYGRRSDSER